ncbi:MAG: endonuclease V-like protein UPF0215 family [bacterium]|jgi:endonuclease V-like protein UPF0215 family
MKTLEEIYEQNKQIRVIGFDDSPFPFQHGSPVSVSGIVCSNTRFEGMLWGTVRKDGSDATDVISELLLKSKFYAQIHIVLIDGIAVGGFNIIDLEALSIKLNRPCVTIMRKKPDLDAMSHAIKNLPDAQKKLVLLEKAGEVYDLNSFVFQVKGANPEIVAKILPRLTDRGNIPESLRIAHLVGSAVVTGQSGHRA